MATGDSYVIITVYLHKSPVYPSPLNKACYVMITVDHPSPRIPHDIVYKTPSARDFH